MRFTFIYVITANFSWERIKSEYLLEYANFEKTANIIQSIWLNVKVKLNVWWLVNYPILWFWFQEQRTSINPFMFSAFWGQELLAVLNSIIEMSKFSKMRKRDLSLDFFVDFALTFLIIRYSITTQLIEIEYTKNMFHKKRKCNFRHVEYLMMNRNTKRAHECRFDFYEILHVFTTHIRLQRLIHPVIKCYIKKTYNCIKDR